MTQVLKLPELSQDYRMAEVQIGFAWIATKLHFERDVRAEGLLNFLNEVFFGNDLGGSPPDEIHLFVEWGIGQCTLPCILAFEFSFCLAALNVLTLIVRFLPLRYPKQNLDSILLEINLERHECNALLLHP